MQEVEDIIAVDEAICIFINDEYYTTLITSPNMIRDLVIGHMICEGLIKSIDEVREIDRKPPKVLVSLNKEIFIDSMIQNRIGLITTACGQSKLYDIKKLKISLAQSLEIEPKIIFDISKELNNRGTIFHQTGGTHSALLSSIEGETLSFAEDVGRHNAVDKVVGFGTQQKYNMGKCILFCSGRLSSDLVIKAARCGIPIIASVAAPLESGIRIAEASGITLISFVRGQRMNVYTHPQRIIM